MTVYEKRRAAVQRLIDERFHGRAADFARLIERSPAQVWQSMNTRNIGEDLARHIESKVGLHRGALDGERPHDADFSREELEFLMLYRQAKPAWKALLRDLATVEPREQQHDLLDALKVFLAKVSTTRTSRRRLPGGRYAALRPQQKQRK